MHGLCNLIAKILPGDGNERPRLFIVEQIGVIKVLTPASILLASLRPFLDISKEGIHFIMARGREGSAWPGVSSKLCYQWTLLCPVLNQNYCNSFQI